MILYIGIKNNKIAKDGCIMVRQYSVNLYQYYYNSNVVKIRHRIRRRKRPHLPGCEYSQYCF